MLYWSQVDEPPPDRVRHEGGQTEGGRLVLVQYEPLRYGDLFNVYLVRDGVWFAAEGSAGTQKPKDWTRCSCGHIAQDHEVQGLCERRFEKCNCRGYDGHPIY